MRLRLLFFAQAACWMGRHVELLETDEIHTVGQLLDGQRQHLDPLRAHLGSLRIAVNQAFALPETSIHDGDEIAFLPPVSGG